MANTGNVLKGLGQILQVPGQLRDAEQQREQQVTEQQMREFDLEEARKDAKVKKISNSMAIVKAMSPFFEKQVDRKAIELDPNSGITQLDGFRERNTDFDEALNTLGSPRGQVGISILSDTEFGNQIKIPIIPENYDEIMTKAQSVGSPITRESLEARKGGNFKFFEGSSQLKRPGIVELDPPPNKTSIEEFKARQDIKLDTKQRERKQKFFETADKQFLDNKTVDLAVQSAPLFQNIRDEVESGNAFATPLIIKSFIRTLERRISNADYILQSGNKSVVRSASRKLKELSTGKLTEKDKDDILSLADILEQNNETVLRNQAKAFVLSNKGPFNATEDEILAIINPQIDAVVSGGFSTEPTGDLRSKLPADVLQRLEDAESRGAEFSDEQIQSQLDRLGIK